MTDRQVAARAAMELLGELAEDLAYGELYTVLAGEELFVRDRRAALGLLAGFSAEERALLALLALDVAVPETALSDRLSELASLLEAAAMVTWEEAAVRADDLVLVPVLRGLLLTATPPSWRKTPGRQRAYLAPDSLRLARALPDATGKSVLDVGTGCGVQGLLAARGARRAVLSDLEPLSLELAECNRVLNRIGGEVSIVAGDAYAPVGDERFDLVVCLPPYLPAVGTFSELSVSGGPDGLALIRSLVAGAGGHLSPGGELVALAQLLCDDDGPLIAAELAELAPGCEARLLLSDWHPIRPYTSELALRLAGQRSIPTEGLRAAFLASFTAQNVTGVCTAIIRLRAKAKASPAVPTTSGLGRRRADETLVARSGLCFSEDRSLRTVSGDGVEPLLLKAPVAALLAAFEGGADVEGAVAAAWGSPAGADPRDLLEQALVHVAELERAGLLEPSAAARA